MRGPAAVRSAGGRHLIALGPQQLLALVVLDPGERAGLACLVRQMLDGVLADELLELRARAAADVQPVRGVVLRGELEDAGATPQTDALAEEPQVDRCRLLTRDPGQH